MKLITDFCPQKNWFIYWTWYSGDSITLALTVVILCCWTVILIIKLLLLKSWIELMKNYKHMGVFNTRTVNDWLTERLMLICWFCALKVVSISQFLGEIYGFPACAGVYWNTLLVFWHYMAFSPETWFVLPYCVWLQLQTLVTVGAICVNANCQFRGSYVRCFSNPLCCYTWSWNTMASVFFP